METNNETVSVIIPVYNRVLKIERCLHSVINQTHQDLEIIIVDDGSTDDSLKACQEFSKYDPRIIIATQENQGASSARNRGLNIATGKYIMFVDCDDRLELTGIETAVSNFSSSHLCIYAYCSIFSSSSEKKIVASGLNTKNELGINSIPQLYKGRMFNPVWNKIYERDIIVANHIKFDSNMRIGEDAVFNLDYLRAVGGKINVNNSSVYFYYENNKDGLDNSYYPELIDDQLLMFSKFDYFLKYHNAALSTLRAFDSFKISTLIATLDRVPDHNSISCDQANPLVANYITKIDNALLNNDSFNPSFFLKIRWNLVKKGLYKLDKKMRIIIKKAMGFI